MGYKVFIDFEMAPVDKKYDDIRKICPREIIQIGAVILDEANIEVGSFKRNVRPQYVTYVSNRLMDLLGITFRELEYCGSFNDCWQEFVDWTYSFSTDITLYAWSESDLKELSNEITLTHMEIDSSTKKLIENWIDLQEEFDKAIDSENQTGLKKALELCGIEFDGKQHDSLIDSRNTAQVYIELLAPEAILKQIELTHKYTEEKSDSVCSLGSLFDFSKLGFAV